MLWPAPMWGDPWKRLHDPMISSMIVTLSDLIGEALRPRDHAAVGILDSDTLEVLHNQRPERIRLSGIDCPEKGQA
jgi:endonuclease YncB( thermonuclease family)